MTWINNLSLIRAFKGLKTASRSREEARLVQINDEGVFSPSEKVMQRLCTYY